MKKLLFLAMALLTLAVSCKKEKNGDPEASIYEPEAIDLGTGVKWASFNLGATAPYEYGDYYAWGEKEPYYSSLKPLSWKLDMAEGYSWKIYKFCTGADSHKLTKYCSVDSYWDSTLKPDGPDGNENLLPEDDAAACDKRLSGKWRMPKLSDFQALMALEGKPDYEFDRFVKYADGVKDSEGREIYGLRIRQISTGNTLFLPAAGYCNGTTTGEDATSMGCYWSTQLNDGKPDCACIFTFGDAYGTWPLEERRAGDSIRPVCD